MLRAGFQQRRFLFHSLKQAFFYPFVIRILQQSPFLFYSSAQFLTIRHSIQTYFLSSVRIISHL